MIIKIEEEISQRLDSYLSEKLDLSRTRIQSLIKEEQILVNNMKAKSSQKLEINDEVLVNLPENKELEIKAQDISIDIVYEDKYLAIINKKPNMVVHPCKGHNENTLVNAIMYKIKDLSGINGTFRPGIVHRLDKDTSGLIIIAKDDKTHLKLSEMFKEKTIKKTYIAIIKGYLNKEEGTIQSYISRDTKDRKKMAVSSTGKLAITDFKLIDRNQNYSLVKFDIKTGRTHQIRVHSSKFLYPILGDSVYGKKDSFNRQMLHAYILEFIHPITNEKMKIKAKLHDDFLEALEKCKLLINFDENMI